MESGRIPRHVAVIMDGNGRWAKKRLLPRSLGHRAGMERMIGLSEHAFDRGVRYVTLFALSTENLARPQAELDGIFRLFRDYFTVHAETCREKGIALRVIGDLSLLPPDVAETVRRGTEAAQKGERGTLTLAIAYGGRRDIVEAANRAVREGRELREEDFSRLLSTGELPPPDLVIRTGGEKRLSNFLLFESAYAELYFSGKNFPDFGDGDLDAAIEDYASRERRFGKI